MRGGGERVIDTRLVKASDPLLCTKVLGGKEGRLAVPKLKIPQVRHSL